MVVMEFEVEEVVVEQPMEPYLVMVVMVEMVM
jgi:hypothetical protein